MDQIKDIKEWKSLAYDEIIRIEQAQANLRRINQHIQEIQNNVPPSEQSD